jgi:16S rRNA (guanine(527)-N(7))-methyltransferase GidB
MIRDILKDGFKELGFFAGETALQGYEVFYKYLVERNKVMNLTAITGENEVARLHFLDCAALLLAADFKGARVIDVGTGAGFPGIPLRISEPDMELTLLDSLGKRVDFLKESCDLLGFNNVTCIHSRAEEAPSEYREFFDIAVSRAVAKLNVLCELCVPFIRVGGIFMAMKGPDPEDELQEAETAISLLGCEFSGVFKYCIPGTDISHTAVIVKKTKNTPEKYPRRFAKIQKSPL